MLACLVSVGRVKVVYINIKEDTATPFTKGLAPGPLWDHVKMHGRVTYKVVLFYEHWLLWFG